MVKVQVKEEEEVGERKQRKRRRKRRQKRGWRRRRRWWRRRRVEERRLLTSSFPRVVRTDMELARFMLHERARREEGGQAGCENETRSKTCSLVSTFSGTVIAPACKSTQ